MTGDDLKQERVARKMSRRALAELCGIHMDTVRYWEGKPSLDLRGYAVKRMLKALGITLAQPPRRQSRPSLFGYFLAPLRARDGVLSHHGILRGPKRCGAKTRKGTPCHAKPIPGKARCKFHGGLSTGPKTPEGRARIAEAQRRRWRLREGEVDISPFQRHRN